ncbi:hypothetical protein N7512_006918 [Penicillium capsulatum]|nr:hypothetical protein N7512_006918 [Penicillium capsulatum]
MASSALIALSSDSELSELRTSDIDMSDGDDDLDIKDKVADKKPAKAKSVSKKAPTKKKPAAPKAKAPAKRVLKPKVTAKTRHRKSVKESSEASPAKKKASTKKAKEPSDNDVDKDEDPGKPKKKTIRQVMGEELQEISKRMESMKLIKPVPQDHRASRRWRLEIALGMDEEYALQWFGLVMRPFKDGVSYLKQLEQDFDIPDNQLSSNAELAKAIETAFHNCSNQPKCLKIFREALAPFHPVEPFLAPPPPKSHLAE